MVGDPAFHAQNVYGIVASTLFEFERSLGRHLSWGFGHNSHQLKVFPHAFLEPNAFYSKYDECLAFGYFPIRGPKSDKVFTCLSHDIVAHETTHALIDGLRNQLMRPSSHDQAAFHEGFADVIALLKILKNEALVQFAVGKHLNPTPAGTISTDEAFKAIREGRFLFGLAQQMGQALIGMGRDALRRSIELAPSPEHYHGDLFLEPHDRGEIFVAAVMRAYLRVWESRLSGKIKHEGGKAQSTRVSAWRVAEEGARAAAHLLNLMIRAIDYLPPIHVEFSDFLSAALTADWQICPDDNTYGYRKALTQSFAEYGINPAAAGTQDEPGVWGLGTHEREISYTSANMDSTRWNPESMFKLLWENYEILGLKRDVFTRLNSVRPVWRVGPEGFVLRETVAEYYQLLKNARKADLENLGIKGLDFISGDQSVDIVGGGTLIFDEFGRLKFHIHNRIDNYEEQGKRLRSLWQRGDLWDREAEFGSFAGLHSRRAFGEPRYRQEGWE
ncbi:MAG: hypothetical protein GKS00_18605 [Alphaproteobacteria bacterium]|nr:hypothetical protein [Alphaproteobacteria bacterium]